MYILGIDVGTSGCKAAVIEENGSIRRTAYREYAVLSPRTGWLELDAEQVWQNVIACIAECCADGLGKHISALAVSTQGEAIIPVAGDGTPLDHAIVTFDTRNQEDCHEFASQVDPKEIMRQTGAPIHPMFSLTKILWFRRQRPEIYRRAWKFLCFGEYIAMRLGAEPCIDYTMAARTMAFDIHTMTWSATILSVCGLPREKLPDPVAAGTPIGTACSADALQAGLSPGTRILAGAHDQTCCALGAGVYESGVAMDSLGTTESILCVRENAVFTREMMAGNLPCYPYPVSGRYAYLAFLSCCGSVLRWYASELLGASSTFAELDGLCDSVESPTGLFVLPHFAGSGTPYLDPRSRGVIAGLTLSTPREAVYKAIMEGTAYEMSLNLELLERCGVSISQFRSIGGGSKSTVWMQIKADVTGRPITAMETKEAGCLGAAMLAYAGESAYETLPVLMQRWVKIQRVYEPRPQKHQQYAQEAVRYAQLYTLSKAMNP